MVDRRLRDQRGQIPRQLCWAALGWSALLPFGLVACQARGPEEGAAKRSSPVTLTVSGWPLDRNFNQERASIDRFTRRTGIRVNLFPAPSLFPLRLKQYLDWLDERASAPDVYYSDLAQSTILSEHMIDLAPYLDAEAGRLVPFVVSNYSVGGRLLAMPIYTDVGLLFYRSDLLEAYRFTGPPRTWDELEQMAVTIQAGERAAGNSGFWGFSWNGAEEQLILVGLEWQASFGGGQIIESDRTITVNNPRTIQALTKARGWVGTISPPSVVSYRREDARDLWLSGNAAFFRGWYYVYGRGQQPESPIRNRFDVTVLPSGGGRHAGTLGGWQFSVSKYSAYPREAAELVRYVASRPEQLRRTVAYSGLPTIADLYDDPEVLRVNPNFRELKQALLDVSVVRPFGVTGKAYPAVSAAYGKAVHSVLMGERSAQDAMAGLEQELVRITGFAIRSSEPRRGTNPRG